MTMDYHHPYNVYPEYYCPSYQGPGYPFPSQQSHPPAHSQHRQQMPNPQRNFNNNVIGNPNFICPPPPPHHQQQPPPQQQQPPQHYFPYQQQGQQQQQQQRQHSSYTSPYVPNFLVSSGTGLTPTLTPTTLATIEQSFMELQNNQQNGGRDPVTQSGFVPPVVDPGHSAEQSQDSYDYSSSDGEWEPKAKRGRMSADMKDVNLIVTAHGTINATPQRKYTRRNKDEKLPPEEEERRRVRRERNKVAAAKCRQRRVDHTNELVEETEELEAEQSKLESEIQSLQQEREQLEFILQAHQPMCKVNSSRSTAAPATSSKVKVEPEHLMVGGASETTGHHHPHHQHHSHLHSSADPCPAPENLSMSAAASSASAATPAQRPPAASAATASSAIVSSSAAVSENSLVASSRPNSLPLIKRDRARMLSVTSATGVSINTPTSGVTITPSSLFCPGLDSMVDGSTGLTPLTGMSCSSQVQRNNSDSSSEAVGSPTLISL